MKAGIIKTTRVKEKPGPGACRASLQSASEASACERRHLHPSLRSALFLTSRPISLPQSPENVARERDSGSRDGLMFPASESQTQTGLKSDLSEEESKGKR